MTESNEISREEGKLPINGLDVRKDGIPQEFDRFIHQVTGKKQEFDLPVSPNKIIISKIQLQNFLSFEEDEVDLNPAFSICTGPNGAGKSSIFQALKFALGSNNYDGRYHKWSDFIRTGQKTARVRVFFQIDSHEYVIQRQVTQKKSPIFALKTPQNSRFQKCTGSVVSGFLKTIRIDPDDVFSFMSQGNIDSIKDFKEETLCTFVEQGIGLTTLKEQILEEKIKIEQLESEFQALITRKDSVAYQLVALEPKLERLEKKREYLEKISLLEDELLWSQREEIIVEIEKVKIQVSQHAEDLTKINSMLKDLDAKKQQILEDKDVKSQELEGFIVEQAKHQSRIDAISAELSRITTQKNDLAEKIEASKLKIHNSQNARQNLNIELSKLKSKSTDITEKIRNESEQLTKKQQEQQTLLHEYQKHQDILNQLNTKKADKKILANEQLLEESRLKDAEEQIQLKLENISQIRHDLESFKWFMNNPNPVLKERMRELEIKLTAEVRENQNHLGSLSIEYTQIQKRMGDIQKSVYDKSLPKPHSIQQMVEEINDRHLHCIGPLIDYITFEDLFQGAVQSIFGPRVLYSFIAKNKETFAHLKHMAMRYKARCNIYLERSNPLPNLPMIENKEQFGIFGYLAKLVRPSSSDPAIDKVIYSVANRTLVMKDHASAINYIERFNLKTWAVTLDGEQIRPKTLVLESRPFIQNNNTKITSVAQARQQLVNLEQKAASNRKQYNQIEIEIENARKKLKIVAERLIQVDGLIAKYRRIEIATKTKNHLINQKKTHFSKINLIKRQIKQLDLDIGELERDLPPDILRNQVKLDLIPNEIALIQETIAEYTIRREEYQTHIHTEDISLQKLIFTIDHLTQEVEELTLELKTSEPGYFKLMQESLDLKNDLQEIAKMIVQNKDESAGLDETFNLNSQAREDRLGEKLNLETAVKTAKTFIRDNEERLLSIQTKLDKKNLSFDAIRTLDEIKKDMAVINEILIDYRDVTEDLVLEKSNLEGNLVRIREKQQILKSEIEAARATELKFEDQFFNRFNESVEKLRAIMNEKFHSAKLGLSADLTLTGEIQTLRLRILATFHTSDGNQETYPLSALSGGQRSMVGICLMLSLNQLNPSPFNIYDEIEMFLDPQNAQVIAYLIHELANSGIQFVILMPDKSKTLLQLADHVVGICRNGKNGPSTVHYCRSQ